MTTIQYEARWSGGMRECAVLVRGETVIPQRDFARHIRHVPGGWELYRADVADGEVLLKLYQSGSGKTETACEIGVLAPARSWDNWDDAEAALGLPEGALWQAFIA
jgi:hypothetical protein